MCVWGGGGAGCYANPEASTNSERAGENRKANRWDEEKLNKNPSTFDCVAWPCQQNSRFGEPLLGTTRVGQVSQRSTFD